MTSILIAVGVFTGIAVIFGFILGLADKFLKVEEDPRLEQVTKMLPGANCGGCGYPGCSGLASAIINKEVNSLTPCKVAKPADKELIKKYLKETPDLEGNTIDLK
ncbi:MAG: electron transporter RnfB [Bacilli bacterium]|mgnify:CR=1 FL=1|nr:electron transporter RnfB [Bacilli bacterium]